MLRLTFLSAVLLIPSVAEPCTAITQVPYVISSPGQYCQTAPLLIFSPAQGSAITINSDDVTLDLKGNALVGGGGSGSIARGIEAVGRRNVTVRNGVVKTFAYAVKLEGVGPNQILDITAINTWYVALWVGGRGSSIERSRAIGVGWSTVPGHTIPIAIRATGTGVRVIDNVVTDVQPANEAVGIHIDVAPSSIVRGNTLGQPSQKARTFAVWVNSSTTTLTIERNTIAMWESGISSSGANVLYLDNVFQDVSNVAFGATDGGGNRP